MDLVNSNCEGTMARNRLEIRLDLIRKNYRAIHEAVSPLETMAVLKADAYGLGVSVVRDTLKDEGCSKFGVADVIEAEMIQDGKSEIYILGDILPEEIPSALTSSFIIPLTSLASARLVSEEALRQGKRVKCQILLDTGMGRLGILSSTAFKVIVEIAKLPNLDLVGIYSHFPFAYGDKSLSLEQIAKVKELLSQLEEKSISFKEVHIANSDGIHNIPAALGKPFNLVRSGINLYGCFDLEGEQTIELKEVLSLISCLVAVRNLPKDYSIGYGCTHVLEKDTKVGTVAIGYADGLPISLSNKGYFLIKGHRCPIIGRVSMDYTTVDLSSLSDVEVGQEVICLGSGIPVSYWAESSGTITYDIICSIGNRVKRVYLG